MGIVRSMALYGAPVWADNLTAKNIAVLRRPQRAMAVRVIRGYRTISYEAATLLAGSSPWDLDAKLLASLYQWRKETPERSERRPVPREYEAHRAELRQILVAEWEDRLARPSAGHAAIAAVSPVLKEWLERRHGALTFRLTQVLSGHGCFGKYLHRIGRETAPRCHHCLDCPEDTAQHTLEECPAWAAQRRDLVAATTAGGLSLQDVVLSMVGSESAWDAVASFCEEVMAAKEAAEREREATSSHPARRRRTRRRRARDDLRPP